MLQSILCLRRIKKFSSPSCSEHERVATKIRNFLSLTETEVTTPMSEAGPSDDNCSTTSDESFEKIDTAELACAEEELAKADQEELTQDKVKESASEVVEDETVSDPEARKA